MCLCLYTTNKNWLVYNDLLYACKNKDIYLIVRTTISIIRVFISCMSMLLAVDKPQWITSFDVIRILKRHFPKWTKIGHSGTLDPMATGLLIIATDKDTKRLHEFLWSDKSYETTIDFSQKTDTWDADFRDEHTQYEYTSDSVTINEKIIRAPNKEELKKQLDVLIPSAILPLTPFSAKKKNGKKLYELAREGIPVNETREMRTNSYEIVDYTFPLLTLKIDVWSGTYIRSIGHWLGREFGLGGILTSLRRTKVAWVDIESLILDKSIENILYTEISI